MHGFTQAIEEVRGALVTPTAISGVPGEISGCVYRSDGSIVELSERFGGYHGDLLRTNNPKQLCHRHEPVKLGGRGLYLGHFMGGHFGHFITETLSTFWAFEQNNMKDFDYVLFHPFVFGLVRPQYTQDCLSIFGVPSSKVRFASEGVLCCESLVVPERLLRLNHSADRKLRWVYEQIAAASEAPSATAEHIYLSRRHISHRQLIRVVANEISIEQVFRERGFNVIYPETLPLLKQVGLYRHCRTLAGLSGSALHNAVFMNDSADLVELGDPRYGGEPAPTQMLCNMIGGVRTHFIPFSGRIFGARDTMIFDCAALGRQLNQEGWPLRSSVKARSNPLRWVASLPEIAYLSLRPSAGGLSRKVMRSARAWFAARRSKHFSRS